MKKYIVEVSESANSDLENIISYIKYDLKEKIIADKYKLLFKQALKKIRKCCRKYAYFKWRVNRP